MLSIGVDTGGTFTDFVVFDEEAGRLRVAKVASVPSDPTRAFMNGLAALEVDLSRVRRIVHGTTIATNAVLERKGARTGVVVTAGHRDIIEIGQLRQYADNVIFNRHYQRPPPYVPRGQRWELAERIGPGGEVLAPVDDDGLRDIVARMREAGIESVAVCLLNAYANPAHERRVAQALAQALPGVPVSESVAVTPEFREYERWATTVLNAYVAPIVGGYLRRLSATLREAGYRGELFYMTSSGGILAEGTAPERPVRFLLSGPAAGVTAGVRLGEGAGERNVITCDMGGTSTDICLIRDLDPIVTHERQFAGTVIRTPQLDIVTIGAGGGSIAWVDSDGSLKVGPQSAGAVPGPACYGRGGTQPTVTDANLLLGHLGSDSAIGGAMHLERDLAEGALRALGGRLGIADPCALAEGIVRICVANMAGAIRTVSVERGLDPRDFTLVPMGGAGPMHAAAIAAELGVARVLVPANPGNACAFGLLATDLQIDYVRTCVTELHAADPARIRALLAELREAGLADLRREGVPPERIEVRLTADIRYPGQSFQIGVPIDETTGIAALEQAFHERYQHVYGYNRREKAPELVYLRARAIGRVDKPATGVAQGGAAAGRARAASREVRFAGEFLACPVLDRSRLAAGTAVAGPAVIEEYSATVLVPPGWTAGADAAGNLELRHTGG